MRYGIPAKERERRYTLDRDFFEEIDTEHKAYALGFIAGDGAVHRSGKQVSIALQAGDKRILYDLRKAMRSNAVVRDKIAGGFPGSRPQKSITFDSKKLVSDLARWGVGPRKSLTLRYPSIAHNLEHHFARGSFDADGHVRAVPKRLFCFLGTEDFIDGLRSAVHRHTGLWLGIYRGRGVWRLSGYGGSRAVLDWMYRDATIFLARKRRVYLDHWQ